MKVQTKTVFLLMTIFVTTIMLSGAPIFAENETASVDVAKGSSVPGCEAINECYIPYEVTVDVGGEVIWSNVDSAAHTVTGGSAADGPSGVFDSSLFMAGTTFSHKFKEAGAFNYFCMVHPWMEGVVVVQEAGVQPMAKLVVKAPSTEETTVIGMSSDGKVRVEITSSNPSANEPMSINLKFRDSSGGGLKQHANYDIVATQNGEEILSVIMAHQHEGQGVHNTKSLASNDAVDIKVTLLGFGLPDNQVNWTGSVGEIFYFNVIPEFGMIAMMILAVAIITTIAVTAKSRVISRF
ncbi:MAG: PEFG-CTERM sorting domain-containing protein [Nitrosopumilus sp.]|jgi:predicted secreted protein with PEFG-CTERM motif|nr:PEFG-CTERM sorting domain-containing protein [Nitrosopumilus sp.]